MNTVIDMCFCVTFKVSRLFVMCIHVTMVVDHSLKSEVYGYQVNENVCCNFDKRYEGLYVLEVGTWD